jgi:predicted CoA-binding protein
MMQVNKTTLVIGASSNPERYSYKAIQMLQQAGHSIKAIGLKSEMVLGVQVQKEFDFSPGEIHTITLYMNPTRQSEIITTLLALNPKRIIFNPGTENEAFMQAAKDQGIDALEACTLVMLSTGQF